MILGAHILLTDGLAKAPEKAAALGCEAIQIFTKNNNQWKGRPLNDTEVAGFQSGLREHQIQSAFAHTSYLINLGSPQPELLQKSCAAIQEEMERAIQLGLAFIVLHPGAHTGSGEEAALKQIAKMLQATLDRFSDSPVKLLLENTAGQGTCVGYSFEHLAELLEKVDRPKQTGICFDTCHAFAAGYDLKTEDGYQAMFSQFDHLMGLGAIKAFHLNDSKKGLGCHVDRHEHIGKGEIGLPFFKHLMNDKQFKNTPMVLETPKGKEQKEDLMNLKILRNLIKPSH